MREKAFKIITFLMLISMSSSALGAKRVYLNIFYGHLHRSPSKYSSIITTFECGQPFKFKGKSKGFVNVEYAKYKGFINEEFISSRRPKNCWQDKYRKLMDNIGLSVSQMYFWARLNELMISGEVMP